MRKLEDALLEAVTAALPILVVDRAITVECATLQNTDGTPDLATLDAEARPAVAEYDRAILLCHAALREAGLQ